MFITETRGNYKFKGGFRAPAARIISGKLSTAHLSQRSGGGGSSGGSTHTNTGGKTDAPTRAVRVESESASDRRQFPRRHRNLCRPHAHRSAQGGGSVGPQILLQTLMLCFPPADSVKQPPQTRSLTLCSILLGLILL